MKREMTVEYLKELGDHAAFGSYSALKSGRDEFSRMDAGQLALHYLRENTLTQFHPDDELKILRWMCRGLPVPMAIKKVEIDKKQADNFRNLHLAEKVESVVGHW